MNRKAMRTQISILLAMIMLLCCFNVGAQGPLPTQSITDNVVSAAKKANSKDELVTKNGDLVVEAENLPFNDEHLQLVSGNNMSDGKGLSVLSDEKTKPANTDSPDLSLNFKADKSAKYTVWMRNTARPSSGNTVWIATSGDNYGLVQLGGSQEEFGWTKLCTLFVAEGEMGIVSLIRRQRFSVVFDKFIITTNKLFVPTLDNEDTSTISEMSLPEGDYPTPTLTPPANVHPRVLFREKDVETIKSNLTAEQNAASYDTWQDYLNTELDGNLAQPKSGATNYNSGILNRVEAYALDYALNNNVEHGKAAIQAVNDYADTVVFDGDSLNYRKRGQIIFTFAEVYDWCFDILTSEDKKHIIAQCEVIATELDIGYPPKYQGAVCGHGGEPSLLRDLLAFGIATYDERPDIYNYVAGRILSEHVATRNYWYTANNHHQGNAYGAYRGGCEVFSNYLFYAMSGVKPFSDDQEYMAYEWLYSRRPDGQVLRDGDDYHESGNNGTYWKGWYSTLFTLTALYGNEYEKREMLREDKNIATYSNQYSMMTPAQVLIMNDPYNNGKPTTQLPLTKYFASPQGMMIARTGWNDGKNAPDVVSMMNISELWGANHDHLDAGNFQLYYKGILASESGDYDDGYGTVHDKNYNKRSIAHNVLTIYDPNEKMVLGNVDVVNDGGQRPPANGAEPSKIDNWLTDEYNRAKVLGYEFGPDPVKPEYTYIKGDLSNAYSDKTKEVLRNMLFMPLEDEAHPAVMIVMDKVESTDATFKKSWLLHMQEEPQVDGNKTTVTRTEKGYNGKMIVETLLPKQVNIEKIGGEGKECWVVDKNYPSSVKHAASNDSEAKGWGRIEVSPAKEAKLDYFLNVMTVSDADTTAPDLQSTLIEGTDYVGAVVSDRVAVFARGKDKIEKSLTFDIPVDGTYKVFVSGLKDGTWYTQDNDKVIVTQEGGAAYFPSNGGTVTLTYKSPNNKKTLITPVVEDSDNVSVRINNAFIYSDVAPVIVEGRTLIPMRAIFEALGAQIAWDEASATATAQIGDTQIKLTENSKTAYVNGAPTELDVTATILDGRFVVPVRFVSEASGAVVDWDQFAQIVDITASKTGVPSKPGVAKDGVATIKSCVSSSIGDADRGENSYDGDIETVWAVSGLNEPITYEFDKIEEIDSIYILLNKATDRIAYFDLAYSIDGTNFTNLGSYKGDGVSDGQVFKLPSPVKAKFFKYVANGNNTSEWNAIKEIEFRLKK